MKRKLLVHIGSSKTGTTTIQRALATARPGAIPFLYPDMSFGRHMKIAQHGLMLILSQRSRLPRRLRHMFDNEHYERAVGSVSAALSRALAHKGDVLLSSEYLFSLRPEEIARFHEMTSEFNVQVCVYVRDPASYYASLAQETCKASKTVPQPRTFRYGFRETIEAWSTAFGDQILVRPFDKHQLVEGDILADFSKLATDYFDCEVPVLEIESANQSFSMEGLSLLQKYRDRFYPDSDNVVTADTDALVLKLQELGTENYGRIRLRPEITECIRATHQDDLAWLEQNHGVRFAETQYVSREELPPSELSFNQVRSADYRRHFGVLDRLN